jgi:hypothetical protein
MFVVVRIGLYMTLKQGHNLGCNTLNPKPGSNLGCGAQKRGQNWVVHPKTFINGRLLGISAFRYMRFSVKVLLGTRTFR